MRTLRDFVIEDDGHDLIEHALVVALIAFAATAAMNTIATDINSAFANIGVKLTETGIITGRPHH
jgi:pilus assembly protein Flp/PilA